MASVCQTLSRRAAVFENTWKQRNSALLVRHYAIFNAKWRGDGGGGGITCTRVVSSLFVLVSLCGKYCLLLESFASCSSFLPESSSSMITVEFFTSMWWVAMQAVVADCTCGGQASVRTALYSRVLCFTSVVSSLLRPHRHSGGWRYNDTTDGGKQTVLITNQMDYVIGFTRVQLPFSDAPHQVVFPPLKHGVSCHPFPNCWQAASPRAHTCDCKATQPHFL